MAREDDRWEPLQSRAAAPDECEAPGPSEPPDGGEDNLARATRRAKASVRRYSLHNRLRRIATTTYADQHADRSRTVADIRRMGRTLTAAGVVWMAVIEPHQSGNHHVHWLLDRYVDKGTLGRWWARGFVDVRMLGPKHEVGRSAVLKASGYAAKYVGKSPVAGPGEHRYFVAQGHQPERVHFVFGPGWDPERAIAAMLGGEVIKRVWSSASQSDWRGPPLTWGMT